MCMNNSTKELIYEIQCIHPTIKDVTKEVGSYGPSTIFISLISQISRQFEHCLWREVAEFN